MHLHYRKICWLLLQIVDFLNDLYSCFDDIISKHDVYKVSELQSAGFDRLNETGLLTY